MKSPLGEPLAPMEAIALDELPEEPGWQYEPKWDGFRCVAAREGARVALWSKAGQPLARYFPDVASAVTALAPERFILDGEIVIRVGGALSFNELQLRLHPAESRVRKLAAAHPATYVAFDLLADEHGRWLGELPLRARRAALAEFAERFFPPGRDLVLSTATTELAQARTWLVESSGDVDGVVAKELAAPYRSGERAGMVKVKRLRTADCVVGGFRYAQGKQTLGSLLLGLYDEHGALHHVGFTSSFPRDDRDGVLERLLARKGPPGFTGARPGGPSRWSQKRDTSYVPLRHELVVEVRYDHFTGGRFRHGTKFLRFRPDKAPGQCTFGQVAEGMR